MAETHFEYHIIDADLTDSVHDMGGAWDLDGDDRDEIVVGGSKGLFWYRYPQGTQHVIDGRIWRQVGLTVHDLTGDGRPNLVVSTWVDDTRHDLIFADISSDGRLELITSSTEDKCVVWYEVPADPRTSPWPKHVIETGVLSEGIAVADINGDGRPDVITGPTSYEQPTDLENGAWQPHHIAPDFREHCRFQVGDINGDVRLDVVVTEEDVDYRTRTAGLGKVTWFEVPEDPRAGLWTEHVIAVRRCPHSLDVVDLDHDGEVEIIVGEHDPFMAYDPRANCKRNAFKRVLRRRGKEIWHPNAVKGACHLPQLAASFVRKHLVIYRRLDCAGTFWAEHLIDPRFEHHDGAHVIRLNGRYGIVSHTWHEAKYVHLWAERSVIGQQPCPMKGGDATTTG
jgi:hypothetical protein